MDVPAIWWVHPNRGKFLTIDWDIIAKSIPLLAEGIVVTLQVSAIAAVLGFLVGVSCGLGALSRSGPNRGLVPA